MGSRYSQIGWSCYECKDKYPACHDTCETYQQARAERDAKRVSIELTLIKGGKHE